MGMNPSQSVMLKFISQPFRTLARCYGTQVVSAETQLPPLKLPAFKVPALPLTVPFKWKPHSAEISPQLGTYCSQSKRVGLQYVSDLHVDHLPPGQVPQIIARGRYLAICGDLGKPNHPNFELLLRNVSRQFEKVFFVAGNHDFDCTPLYVEKKVNHYQPIIRKVCNQFPNIHYLDRNAYELPSFTTNKRNVILGTTLWSLPLLRGPEDGNPKYVNHIAEFQKNVEWLEAMIHHYQDANVYVLTHNVPSFQLIEQRYLDYGQHRTSWFATSLEHLIGTPVRAWLCGHSHSVLEKEINGVHCGLNAYGYKHELTETLQKPKVRLVTLH